MKKKSIKEFFRQKKVAAGCVAAAVIIAAGSFGISWQSQDEVYKKIQTEGCYAESYNDSYNDNDSGCKYTSCNWDSFDIQCV